MAALGCGFGRLDEGIKVLLATREFDIVDIVKDWVGVWLGTVAMWMLTKGKK